MRGAGLVAGGILLLRLMAFVAVVRRPAHDMHSLPGHPRGRHRTPAGHRRRRTRPGVRRPRLRRRPGPRRPAARRCRGIRTPAARRRARAPEGCSSCSPVSPSWSPPSSWPGRRPGGDGPFVARRLRLAVGTARHLRRDPHRAGPVETAAVCAPALRVRAGLPAGPLHALRPAAHRLRTPAPSRGGYDTGEPASQEPVDAERIAAQTRRGHELLVGLVGGCALVSVGASIVLGFSSNVWAQLLALATGVAMLMRAHLFRYTAQVGARWSPASRLWSSRGSGSP